MSRSPTLVKTMLERNPGALELIHEFEKTIEKYTDWDVVKGLPTIPPIKFTARLVYLFGTILDKILRLTQLARSAKSYLSIGYVAPHYLIYKTFPYFSIPSAGRMVWIYDAWENQFKVIESVIRRYRLSVAFISSRQSAEHFESLGIPGFKAYWLPEAVTVADHKWKAPAERQVDVLQLGRRWDWYHARIVEFCRKEGFVYLYEKSKGEIIFPTRDEFIEGLANSKISICVPSNITNPERSGRVSTMTWRYLQSMASKCLIVGKLPEEMKQLFDYCPILEIDMDDPEGQLRQVLSEYMSYVPLIERNYAFVEKEHQWPNRIEMMRQCLADCERNIPIYG